MTYFSVLSFTRRELLNPANLSKYPKSLDSAAKKNLYDNLNQNEQLALDVDNAVYESLTDDWLNNLMKLRKVENAIKKILKDDSETDRILEVVKNQVEYLRYASNYSK